MVGGETNLKTPMLIHDPSSIFYLHPSEGTGMSITKYVLNGDNYDVWALAVMNGLEGKNKQGFINGEIAKPTDEQSPEFMAWRSNNSTICGWLFNSIDISIQPSVVGHKIAIDMWNDIKERYAIMNGPRIHQLKIEYHTLRQKGMTVVNYYNKFKSLWDALYGVEDITCGCNCAAAAKIRLRAERDKTHDFLMGLDDDEFRSIRTQILGMDPFPVLNRAFSLVTQEERHKNIIRGRDDKNDILSFAVQSTTPIVATTPPRFAPLSQPPIAPLTCTYCDKIGHDYDHCYERLGYPTSGRGRGRGSGRGGGGGRGRGGGRGQPRNNNGNTMPTANAASSSNVAPLSSSLGSSFTPDQVQRLLHLIDSPSATTMNGEKMQSIEQGMERKILVRSLNNIKDKVQYQNEDGNMVEEIFRREEFHIVDLKLDKIYHNCLPSLRRAAEVGEMVALGQSIFIFGGENEISSPLPDSQLNYYVGASHLHFGVGVGVGGTWGPAPINDPNEYNYTYLNGDVYCIGNVLAPKVLHVDTTNGVPHGSWKSLGPLPSKLVDCSPSMPVIPDPTNNRILIHLNDGQLSSSSLYAFYPPTHGTCAGTWKCLDSNVSDWDRVQDAALLDGVLYLHAHKLRNLVHAYEVATAKWFDVQWSTRVIEKDFSVDDCTSFRFDSLFCLDDTNKILCLAVYSPVVPIVPGGDRCDRSLPTNTTLLFFKFKAERCGSTITLTPLYTRSYEILSTYQVLDFLPL